MGFVFKQWLLLGARHTPTAGGGAMHARMKPSPESLPLPQSRSIREMANLTRIMNITHRVSAATFPLCVKITSSAQFAMHFPSPRSGGSALRE